MPLISVGTAATLIVEANTKRQSIVLVNSGPSVCHIGQTNAVTTDDPYLVLDGTLEEDNGGTRMYMGPYYGIAPSATASVGYWERTR